MVTQEAADCLPKSQSKTIGPDNLTASDCQEKLETLRRQSSEKQVCDRAPDEDVISQPCVNLAEAASTELTWNVEETLSDAMMEQEIPEEFAFPSPDPAFTLEIHASPRSEQGARGTCSLPSSSVNPSDVQPRNISSYTSLLNSLLFSDPFEYELEKLRREEGNLRNNFEETTSELMAELERKMAEARSEFDRKSKEIDVEYKAKVVEEEAKRSLVTMSSLLANAFMSKATDRIAATDLAAALRAVHGTLQTPPPSASAASSPPVHGTVQTPQTRPPPLIPNITPLSSSPPVHGTERTPQPRPPPLIPNITPSSSSPPVHGTVQPPLITNKTPSSASSLPVRRPAPHLQRFRPSQAPNTAAASTIYPRSKVQEQQQQQGNLNGDVVCLSDDDD